MKSINHQIKNKIPYTLIICFSFIGPYFSYAKEAPFIGFTKSLNNNKENCINSMAVTNKALKVLRKKMKENNDKPSIKLYSGQRTLCKMGLLGKNHCHNLEFKIRKQIKNEAKDLGFRFKLTLHKNLGIYSVNKACSSLKHNLGLLGSKAINIFLNNSKDQKNNKMKPIRRCEVVVEKIEQNTINKKPNTTNVITHVNVQNDNIPYWSSINTQTNQYVENYGL